MSIRILAIIICLFLSCTSKEDKLSAALDEVERLKLLKTKLAEIADYQELLVIAYQKKIADYKWDRKEKNTLIADAKNEINTLHLRKFIGPHTRAARKKELEKKIADLEATKTESLDEYNANLNRMLKQEEEMIFDLKTVRVLHDSINTLHINTIFAMSKMIK